jgi:transposase
MANRRLDVINFKHLIRLSSDGMSYREIAKTIGISKTTVQEYLSKIKSLGLDLNELREKSNEELNFLLKSFSSAENKRSEDALEYFRGYESKLLARKLTRKEIYEFYIFEVNNPLSYSQFCTKIASDLNVTDAHMHIEHKPGEKLFVDYTGKKLHYTDKLTGEKIEVEVFVAILGHSHKTYICACPSQQIEDFLTALKNALNYYCGVTIVIIPDNLKSGVNKASRHEAVINERFRHFCDHYECFPYPTRPYSPRDKNLVEGAVNLCYRYIFRQIKQSEYYSLAELNDAIFVLLEEFNNKKFSNREYSRNDLFETNEKMHMKPLPEKDYESVKFCHARVRKNYHVYLAEDKHYYSVPYKNIGERVKILYNTDTVEIFFEYSRIATHMRDRTKYGYTTSKEHMPPNHKYLIDLTPEKLMRRADEIGIFTAEIADKVFSSKNYYEQKIKTVRAILSLARKIGVENLELCCKRAEHFGVYNYQQIKAMAEQKLYLERLDPPVANKAIDNHKNKRGREYYSVPLSPESCTSLPRISYEIVKYNKNMEAECLMKTLSQK